MRNMNRCAFAILLALIALFATGCTSSVDSVQDPLMNFYVDSTLPFATRAPVAQATPTAAPTATPRATATPYALNWQNESGTGNTTQIYTPRPTVAPTPAPTLGPREEVLSRGSTGNNVLSLQQRLISLGYLASGADGKYGQKTETAVKLFQQTMGLTATGTADLLTLKYLYADVKTYSQMLAGTAPVYASTPVPSTQNAYPLLQRSNAGADVTKLQSRLVQLGYMDAEVDGDYGAITEAAVRLFQQRLGWEQTGVATSSLQSYLYSSSAPVYNGNSPATAATAAPSTGNGYTVLSPGDTGNAVKRMQTRLKELGYFDGEIGGNYLAKTTSAVKLFQRALGLEQTGVATAALQQKLFSSSAPANVGSVPTPAPATAAPAPTYTTLSYGSSGEAVRQLQSRLKELGYFDGNVGGNYLEQTQAAVMLFQSAAGTEATGVANAALQKYLYSGQAPSYTGRIVAPVATVAPGSSSTTGEGAAVLLQPGDTGSKVRTMQSRLKELGYFDGEVGGNYLTKTTDAVKLLQKMMGYSQNGSATYALMERLLDESEPTFDEANLYSKLAVGDKSDAVYLMQLRLIELGFFPDYDASDAGIFGNKTLAAVTLAQTMRGLKYPDDFASAEFQAYLFSDFAYFNSYIEIGG